MGDLLEDLEQQLLSLSDNAAVTLHTDVNSYFISMKGLITHGNKNNYKIIYIAATIPSRVIIEQLKAEDIKTDNIYFVDCISFMVGSRQKNTDHQIFIESPTMLESIMLKVAMWIKRLKEGKMMVVLDAVNTLSVHNDWKIMSEFLHYLINHLRVRNIPILIMDVEGQTPEDLENILSLVCDDTITIKENLEEAQGGEDSE